MANDFDELIISSDELKEFFQKEILQDRKDGWYYKDTLIDIIALHKEEPKHIYDIANSAQRYKLKRKEKYYKR